MKKYETIVEDIKKARDTEDHTEFARIETNVVNFWRMLAKQFECNEEQGLIKDEHFAIMKKPIALGKVKYGAT